MSNDRDKQPVNVSVQSLDELFRAQKGIVRDMKDPWVAMALFERQRCLDRVFAVAEIVSKEYPDLCFEVRCEGADDDGDFLKSSITVFFKLKYLAAGLTAVEIGAGNYELVRIPVGSTQYEIEFGVRRLAGLLNASHLKSTPPAPES